MVLATLVDFMTHGDIPGEAITVAAGVGTVVGVGTDLIVTSDMETATIMGSTMATIQAAAKAYMRKM